MTPFLKQRTASHPRSGISLPAWRGADLVAIALVHRDAIEHRSQQRLGLELLAFESLVSGEAYDCAPVPLRLDQCVVRLRDQRY